MYERYLTRAEKKELGQYYTPPALASHLLDQAGYVAGQGLLTQQLLDVATGFGVFLAQAARRLIDEMRATNLPLAAIVELLDRNLQGYDLQPFAVIATKFHILAVLIDELRLRRDEVAYVCATLQLPGIKVADTLSQVLDVSEDQAPHFVIGNPPYGACRHGPHLTPYRHILVSRANYYQLFFYFALRRCRPGGCVALLVPESMRAGQYFRGLRQYVAEETRLLAMTDFHARTAIFGGVEQGVLVLATRKKPSESHDTSRVTVVQTATVETLSRSPSVGVPRQHVQAGLEADYLLLKASSKDAYALLNKLLSKSSCQARIRLPAHTGPFVWNRHRTGFTGTKVPNSYAVIYAPSIRRYGFSFPPDSEKTPCRHRLYAAFPSHPLQTLIDGQTLLLQRTTAREQLRRLVATTVPAWFIEQHPNYLVENHVNYISGAACGRTEVALSYVLALLNARLLNFLFGAINGSTQVSAHELSLLPLLYDHASPLDVLAESRLKQGNDVSPDLDRTIDDCVYDIYGLTPAERRLVDSYHMASHSGTGRLLAREP